MAVAGGGSGWMDDGGEGEIRGSINGCIRGRSRAGGGHVTHSMTTACRGAEAETYLEDVDRVTVVQRGNLHLKESSHQRRCGRVLLRLLPGTFREFLEILKE